MSVVLTYFAGHVLVMTSPPWGIMEDMIPAPGVEVGNVSHDKDLPAAKIGHKPMCWT